AVGRECVGFAGCDIWGLRVLRIKISTAQVVLAADVVDLGHELLVCLDSGWTQIGDLAVRPVGQRNVLKEILRGRAELAGGNLVAGKGLIRGRIPDDGRDIGEVAGALLRGGNESDAGGRGGTNRRALPGAEEEQLVADDASARRHPELIALLRVLCLGEEVARIEIAVA